LPRWLGQHADDRYRPDVQLQALAQPSGCATVLAMLADGMGAEDILAEHPDRTVEDIHEPLLYAAEAVRERDR